MTDFDNYRTISEAADYLNVSAPYIVKLLNEGKLPYRMVGVQKAA